MVDARTDPTSRPRRTVWIVNHYASAPDRPAGTRHFDLARSLVARGHEVTIFAASTSHLTGEEERLTRGRLYRSASFDGVRFVWLRTTPYRGNDWRRQLNMLSFLAAFLVVQSRYPRPDVVIGSTVHPFAAFGAWLASRARGARFVFEIRDLWPQTLIDLGALRMGSPGERLLRAMEAVLVRRASAVISLLPGIGGYLEGQSLPVDHLVYIPNGVDLARFDASPSGPEPDAVAAVRRAVDRLRAEGRFVLGYVGAFGRVNRADLVAEAAAIAERSDPRRVGLVLVGDGPERSAVERVADQTDMTTVCRTVPKRWVPSVLRILDATIVHTTYTPVYRYGISFNKLFEYMAAERPVLFACESAYDPVEAVRAGITVPPDDPDRLAGAMLELARLEQDALLAMGAAGRAYVEQEHSMAGLSERLARVIEAPTRRRRRSRR